MKKQPPDDAAIAIAKDLVPWLNIAVEAVRASAWRPGDSIEELLAPAVVAIAKEAGKAVGPHAEQVRSQIAAELEAHAAECRDAAGMFDDERFELLADEAKYFAAAARYISSDLED